jgi:hypothetical protein
MIGPLSSTRGRRGHAAAALTLALLLGACGGGKDSAAGSKVTGVPEATTPTTAAGTPDPNAVEQNDPGDIPDDQVFVTYSPPSGGYSVKVPEGWSRSESGGVVTFTDKFNSIRMESKPMDAAPTVASVRTIDVPALEQSEKGFKAGNISTVTRKAGSAIRLLYGADSEPNAVTGKSNRLDVERYVFWKSGTGVILTLSGAKGADNVDPWKIVTDGFAWK